MRALLLALYGEHDWFETLDATAMIADVVNRLRPDTATFRLMPCLDHHFTRYPSRQAAFREQGGTPDPSLPVATILDWLRTLLARPPAATAASPAATGH